MVISIKVDIVGGSISGLSSAISLKEQNPSSSVIVHEKYKTIGYNHEGRRCGEAHTVESEWKKWIPAKKCIFNMITLGEAYVQNKKYLYPRQPNTSYILNRQEFICQLAARAKKLGVVIKTDDKIKSVGVLDGDFIIDASGCPSSIKRELGLKHSILGTTYQQTIEDSNYFKSDTATVIFSKDFCYFWIFPRNPKKREINLGVGFFGNFHINLKDFLESFKKEQKITGKINYITGGPIPLGLQKPLHYKNILFVGDAGVGAFPFTGQGIYRALISGEVAGWCLVHHTPSKYSIIMQKKFIKWDVIGKIYIKMNYVIRRINPKLVFVLVKYMVREDALSH
jgi:flavin-dependent dehydrogenase